MIAIHPSGKFAVATATLACLMFLGVALASDDVSRMLLGEDGIVEIASAGFYLVGLVFAVHLARRTAGWSRVHWAAWALFCVIFFGEETSWLQHWLGFETPEGVKALNAQSEFNLHNLKALTADAHVINPEGKSFSWKMLLSSQNLFQVGFTLYFLLLPALMLKDYFRRLAVRLGFPEINWRFVVMVWIPLIVSVGLTAAYRNDSLRKALIAETREMFFAFTIALLIVSAFAARKPGK